MDVKGNNLPDEVWVEFKNVEGDGWLYGGATILLLTCLRKVGSRS